LDKERYLESVKKGKPRNGRNFLIAHLEGKKISPLQAIRAWCYDCMGFYDDGLRDCERETCPLHPFMPFNPNRIKLRAGKIGENPENLRKWREAHNAEGGESQTAPDYEEDFDEEEREDGAGQEN
jgi:hypothetical protein